MVAKWRIWITGVMMALTAVTTPVAFAQISAEQTLAIGRQLIDSEDYALAVQYLGKAIQAKPYLAEPYYLRGLAKMLLGDFTGAAADCTTAIDLDSYLREPYRVRGVSRMQLGQDSAAVADFNTGLSLLPDDRTFLFYSALAYDKLGKQTNSRKAYDRVHRLYPHFIPAYTAHARSLLMQHDTVGALALLDNMRGYGANSAEPTLLRVDIYLSQHQWAKALKCLNIALRLMPHNDALFVNRGVVRNHMGDKQGAAADFHAALELNPANKQALSNLSGGEPTLAPLPLAGNILLPTQLPVQPTEEQPCGLFALSFTHPYDDLHPLAYPYRELPGLNIAGRYPSPIYLSGRASDTPDADQAVALFAYAEEGIDHPTPERLLGRAVAYSMLKNYESALTDLNQIIAAKPGLALPYLERAYVRASMADTYRQQARRAEKGERMSAEARAGNTLALAIEDLDRALAIDPDMVYALYDKAVLLAQGGEIDQAINCYNKVLTLNPKFAQAYLNRGLLYSALGDKHKAIADWSRAGELGLARAYLLIRYNSQSSSL
ncbi:MAG: tetratricopeptide repeat protein [Muribaculaceae bacterium]|nr:tetratricopeptide repeat protein [Muribaculaceae bacterium]